MVIAGDHKNGDAGDHHRIKRKLGKARKRRSVIFIKGREEQHRKGGGDHHIKRDHVDGEHRVHRDVFDEVEAVGH